MLIRGESGVGKELVSRAIHQRSTRRNRPFVKVNCAALPAELLESELFGHEKGAFTGAATTRIGKFEQADGGTLMLDEIGEMKPALQAKLLHVLQDAEFTKLGSNKRVEVDVRIVAATNRDLEKMMISGDFREDLYYRLHVIELIVPPLRERRDEIPTLLDSFIARYSRKYKRQPPKISTRSAAPVPGVRLARQHPRAREHDQAAGHPPGRAAGVRRDRAQHAARRRRADRRPGGGDGGRRRRRRGAVRLRDAGLGADLLATRRRRRGRRRHRAGERGASRPSPSRRTTGRSRPSPRRRR